MKVKKIGCGPCGRPQEALGRLLGGPRTRIPGAWGLRPATNLSDFSDFFDFYDFYDFFDFYDFVEFLEFSELSSWYRGPRAS